MSIEAAFTLAVLLLATAGLALEISSPDALLLAALAAVTAAGVIDLETALEGFANSTLLALGALYVVAAALRESGALDRAATVLLGRRDVTLRGVLVRISASVAAASAFLNNTPIVAMGVPAVRGWARRHGASVSKLLMPLSFASILGGLCTLIGTSTNLVTDGLLRSHGYEGLGFFELAWVGVPCAVIGVAFLVHAAPVLLRTREDVRGAEERERRALVCLELQPGAGQIGTTVQEAGLERLPGLTLARIDRGEQAIAPVDGDEELHPGDRLFYAAAPDAPTRPPELTEYPGLRLALTRSGEPVEAGGEEPQEDRELHEAVVKEGSRLIGSTVREADFLERFNAAVTGVRRGGQRLDKPIGEIVLRPGDTLMLDTGRGFREAFEDTGEFYVMSEAGGAETETPTEETSPDRTRMLGSALILAGVVGLAATRVLHIGLASLVGALLLIFAGFVTPGQARESVDWSVLLVIGAALGLGRAMEASGAATAVGDVIVGASAVLGPVGVLGGVVAATMVLTGLITNNAAAALMFPIALSVAESQGLDPRPMFIAVTVAASLALWTPLGYQTNLMVYGPGNYRFTDFTRLGLPLQLLLAVVAVVVIPLVWPLSVRG